MTIEEVRKKYIRVTWMFDQWVVYLEIDHQRFRIDSGKTMKEAEWMQDMLAVALERMINKGAKQ